MHQLDIVRRFPLRLVIPPRSGQPQQLTLPGNRKARMIGVDPFPPGFNQLTQTFFLASPVPLSTGRSGGRVRRSTLPLPLDSSRASGKTSPAVRPAPVASIGESG